VCVECEVCRVCDEIIVCVEICVVFCEVNTAEFTFLDVRRVFSCMRVQL